MNSLLIKLGNAVQASNKSMLSKLASAIPTPTPLFIKIAQSDPSQFDETVPPIQQSNDNQDPNSPAMTQDQRANETGPSPESGSDDIAATPSQETPEAPEQAGVRAAQAFIGPEIMQMAMQGDANAVQIVGAAAGHVARAMASGPLPQATPQDEGAPGEMDQPPQATSPEDDLAAVLAPLPNETLQQVEGGGTNQNQPATQY